ncbi:acyltransferase [Turicibacter sanguinis]|uniref:acyltransferase n=1 Tax=Turicibacter sanguinis TaxID=154288 RepID=UPI001897CD98|nr:acyltransferase [Turicibacter sanguinis]MDB8555544.1 acyltransferase [Turicibacter sanguinis]
MSLKVKVYSIIGRLFPRCLNSKMKTAILKEHGIDVGENTVFFDAGRIEIDTSRPALLKIGSFCKITSGVVILTHDYSRSVLRRKYGCIIGEARKTVIGDNVFIGMNSIVLMGTNIGNNTIVGAGSVCHGYYPDNCVIAGNPAKVLCSLDEYYKKRTGAYVEEAKEYVACFKGKYKRTPNINEMGAFFPIFLERNIDALKENRIKTNLSGDIEESVIEDFFKSEPKYDSYEDFLRDCGG